jgi:hypothetical protein
MSMIHQPVMYVAAENKTEMMTAAHQDLGREEEEEEEEEDKCPVCLEDLTDTNTLPLSCGHALCKGCDVLLRRHNHFIAADDEGLGITVIKNCPVCRRKDKPSAEMMKKKIKELLQKPPQPKAGYAAAKAAWENAKLEAKAVKARAKARAFAEREAKARAKAVREARKAIGKAVKARAKEQVKAAKEAVNAAKARVKETAKENKEAVKAAKEAVKAAKEAETAARARERAVYAEWY